jgi:biopolymer transport protein ExbD
LKIREKKTYFSEIILSPILDLSLMLVIFLAVTTEFLSGGEIKVQVPKGGAAITQRISVEKITIDKWGKVFYKGKTYPDVSEIISKLPKDCRVYIKADRETPYMYIFSVLDKLRKANVKKISLIGERTD